MSIVIAIVFGLIIVAGYIACAARMNDRDQPADNTGSETGIEADRELKSWEGWK